MAHDSSDLDVNGLNFEGQIINVVHLGLGTNSTFIHNLAGAWHEWGISIDWFLEATSTRSPNYIQGVAVGPVTELVSKLANIVQRLPGVELVQAAIGEEYRCDA